MEQKKPHNNVYIIGNKNEKFYLSIILDDADLFDEIVIRTMRNYLSTAEHIALKLKYLGYLEIDKKIVREKGDPKRGYSEIEVFIFKLEKIPALKGIREQLTR